ncbi:methyltransferase domain-containing protein [Clostridium sp. AL.422]|uniref:methyltransferase domain-containing protein n=1 Tax=Clostridium TaxID=1485 RepID=UPI00293DB033|nr:MULTISPECIES: methyltransferase domain-containing protein [unclassified Clostridium]MDV4152002.1 methyltransferase domain-containing protein [Clostridium sp. AL.422]
MEKALDKINKAFSGEMGEAFKDKTRQRIFWMMSKVQGENVLDIGCSQGITSILLGREGKKVIGIDALSESIEFANEELMSEEPEVRENVKFISANIVTTDLEFNKFDTIIMGEILEHLSNCDDLLKKAWELGKAKSRCIITVPFGINDYFDHKKTYYYGNLLKDINPYYEIVEKNFWGKWLGLVLVRRDIIEKNNELLIPIQDLLKQEENIFNIERELIDKAREVNKLLEHKNLEIEQVTNKYEERQKNYFKYYDSLIESKDKKIFELIEKNNTDTTELWERINSMYEKIHKEKCNYEDENISKQVLQIKFDDQYKKNITLEENNSKLSGLLKEEKKRSSEAVGKINELNQLLEEERKKNTILQDEKINLSTALNEVKSINSTIIDKLTDENKKLQELIKSKEILINNLTEENKQVINKYDELIISNKVEKAKNEEKLKIKEDELIAAYYLVKEGLEKEECALEAISEKITELEKMEQMVTSLSKKYNSLKNSKLGKITVKYWSLKRNVGLKRGSK